MKSNIIENRYYIECACKHPDHLLVFDVYQPFSDEDRYCMIDVSFTSKYHDKLWPRIKTAIRYIFGSEKFLKTSDCILLNAKNIGSLETAIKNIKKNISEKIVVA